MKPPTKVELLWEHDLVLSGTSGKTGMTMDSAGVAGPSPMQALGFAIAGCMAMDVVHVLKKGRHDFRGLKVSLAADRAPEDPHRFTAVTLIFTVTGTVPPAPIQRAMCRRLLAACRPRPCTRSRPTDNDIQAGPSCHA